MTFEEKLDRARAGSRAAYESLCLGSLDKLYTAAVIALKDEKTAKTTVISAINDGYAGISRIRDEKHLRSWLVHELTKNEVDKLKELKADGVSHTATGVFAETGRLPDVERLVFSVSCVFGYGAREISVLTGMAENTVNEKLSSAKNRLGAAYETVCSAAESFTAPDQLRGRYTGFDESVARIEEPGPAKPPETASVPETPAIPVPTEKPVEKQPAEQKPAEQKPVEHEAVHQPAASPEQEEDEAVFSEDDGQAENEGEYYDEDDDGYEDDEPVFDEPDEQKPVEQKPGEQKPGEPSAAPETRLNAETFIAVVSAEKMKGSEFLRLIGNTRISNSAYREIEQNPRLTKKRLIQLLEESPLTETDYYKLLTAVKNRREVLDAREENRLALERAGLFDGSRRDRYKRKRREKPKTDLELAIGIGREHRPVQPLTFEENAMEEDDTDFQLQNATGSFEQHKILNERRKNDRLQKDMDLGSVISSHEDENDAVDPMSHTALHNIFYENDAEPVDPFAAIDAKATGKPSMPDRIDAKKNEWLLGADSPEPAKKQESDNPLGTVEFALSHAEPGISDTKPFDSIQPDISWDEAEKDEVSKSEEPETASAETPAEPEKPEAPAPEEETPATAAEKEPEQPSAPYIPETAYSPDEDDDDPGIETIPAGDGVSVTQIISEYAIGETVSDEEAEQAYEPEIRKEEPAKPAPAAAEQRTADRTHGTPKTSDEKSVGFAPVVGLVFDAASDSMDDGEAEDLSFSFDDKDDDDDDDFDDEPRRRPAHEKHRSKQPEPDEDMPAEPHNSARPDPDDDYGDPDDESYGRKRYKGNEYFIDDNEYYEGVNRGKIITCAVLAVLLAAGSAGMKYLPFGNSGSEPVINDTAITSETTGTETTSAETEPVHELNVPEEVKLTKLSSYDDLTSGAYENADVSPAPAAGYLRASAEPFASDIVFGGVSASALITDETAYIWSAQNDCTFRAFPVGEQTEPEAELSETDETTDTDTDTSVAEEPAESADTPKSVRVDEKLLHAYTSIGGDLYVVCAKADNSGNALYETQILVYGKDLSEKSSYSVSGSFTGAGLVDGKLVVSTCSDPAQLTSAYNNGLAVSKHPYWTDNGELHEIPASDIYAIDGAAHNAINMIYTAGGGAPLTVAGGTGGSVRFGAFDMSLAVPDGELTYGIDIAKDLQILETGAYPGTAFSADCTGHGGMIGQTESGICAYKNGKTVTIPDAVASSIAWSDKGIAYVVAGQDGGGKMLYGFDMSGDAPESAVISASDIYTDKLIKAGDGLAGLKAEPAPDGERAGLRLSLYEYDGELKETAYSIIELDKETPRENLKYLSSPAETLPTFICTNEDGTLFAVPTIYFDGYSEVERVVLLRRDGALFSLCGEYITYDEKSSVICAAIRGSKLYIVTDTKVTETDITEQLS